MSSAASAGEARRIPGASAVSRARWMPAAPERASLEGDALDRALRARARDPWGAKGRTRTGKPEARRTASRASRRRAARDRTPRSRTCRSVRRRPARATSSHRRTVKPPSLNASLSDGVTRRSRASAIFSWSSDPSHPMSTLGPRRAASQRLIGSPYGYSSVEPAIPVSRRRACPRRPSARIRVGSSRRSPSTRSRTSRSSGFTPGGSTASRGAGRGERHRRPGSSRAPRAGGASRGGLRA